MNTNSGDRGLGEKVELLGAFAYDVLDPVCVMTLDVVGPDGKYVKDATGVLLDGTQNPTSNYTLELKDFGDYTIRYVVKDGKEKTDTYVYAVTAKDVTGPTIEIKKHKETAKSGATVKLAEAKAKDDVSEKCTLFTYVFNPEGIYVKVVDGKFETTMPGTYTVRYMAFDENKNCTFASYEVNVK